MRLGTNTVFDVAVSWTRPSQLYAGAVWGLYVTDSCGSTWEQVFGYSPPTLASSLAQAVATDPSGRTYVSMWGNTSQTTIHIRPDDTRTWAAVDGYGGKIFPVATGGFSVSAAGRIYAQVVSTSSIRNAEAFGYSDDGGVTWTIRRGIVLPRVDADPLDRTVLYAFGWREPQQPPPGATPGIPPDLLSSAPPYPLIRSSDSGVTFQPWSQVDERPGELAVSADGSRFWIASYNQHLWQSRDRGQSWQILDAMPFSDPRQLAVHPHDPRLLYAVSGDGYIWVYREPDRPASSAAAAQIP